MNDTYTNAKQEKLWSTPVISWVLLVVFAGLLLYVYRDPISYLLNQWEKPEYGYAYMLPFISAFLIWQRKNKLATVEFSGSWGGVFLILFAITVFLAGRFGAVNTVMQYSLLLSIIGIAWAFLGYKAFKLVLMPLIILGFAIPLPGFVYQSLSNDLQLISSKLGVAFIRIFDISVYLEGNVIDLGTYKLQVVEACNGLRYLFPLMTLGFVAAYFYKVQLWKRIVVFISTIPITVLMNSLRIGIIGILVEHWGVAMAEGFLHDFEGWVVFMACLGVLFLEMWMLARIGNRSVRLSHVFGIDLPEPIEASDDIQKRYIPKQMYVALTILMALSVAIWAMPERVDVVPDRKDFNRFPLSLNDWDGKVDRMESIYLDALNLDDYLLARYRRDQDHADVMLYIGYYGIQRADKVPHSPSACLPGGGWIISERDVVQVDNVIINNQPLFVNRFVIEQKGVKQLVYYWFQQRGRVVDSEYLVKWYLLVDSMQKHRSDGALVRLSTVVPQGGSLEDGDARLRAFVQDLVPILHDYVPN